VISGTKNSIKNIEKEFSNVKKNVKFTEELFDRKILELHNRIDRMNSENDNLEDQMRQHENRNRSTANSTFSKS